MNIITWFIGAGTLLSVYYILKIYYNYKMKSILTISNCVLILIIIIDYIFIGNQELFDIIFPMECLNICIWFYYLFDKSNFELYNILAKTKAIPIMIGSSWFFKGKKEINSIIEFFNSNKTLMNKSKDIHIILINRNKKTTDVFLVFNKKANVDFYKDNIVNNISYRINSKGRCLMVSFERN
ncbi:MAG: hypothetical protein N2B06_02600 [Clostridium sp.]